MFILTAFNLLIMASLIVYAFYRLVKTKDILTLVSFTLQLSAFTIVLLSVINNVQTSSLIELFYIICGIVFPCGFIAFDYHSMIKSVKRKGSYQGLITTVDKNTKVPTGNSAQVMSVSTSDTSIADAVTEIGLIKDDLIKGIRKKLIQAEAYYTEGDYDNAFEIYQNLISIIVSSSNLYFNFANTCFKKGMLNDALSNYRKVLELNEQFIEKTSKPDASGISINTETIRNIQFKEYLVYYNIGVTYLNTGKLDFALDTLKKSLKINPAFDNAKEGIGRVLTQSGKKLEAVRYYEEILEKDPKNYEISLMLGKLAVELNSVSKAQECFEQCMKISSDNPEGYTELGNLLMSQKKFQDAAKVFKSYIKIKRSDYNGHYNLAGCYYQTDNLDKAVNEYENALKLNPKSYQSAFNLGLIYEEKLDYEKAIESYKNALLINIDFIDAYNNLGILLSRQKRHFEALATYANGIKVSPDNFRLYYNMGVVLFELRRYEDAADAFSRASEINPDDIDVCYYLGASLTELKKYDEAINVYSKALGEVNAGEIYYNIAAVNALMKKQDIAIENLKRAIGIDPHIREQACLNNVFDYMHGNPEFIEVITEKAVNGEK